MLATNLVRSLKQLILSSRTDEAGSSHRTHSTLSVLSSDSANSTTAWDADI